MSTDTGRGRFPWGLTIASALVFVLLVTLGVWQVQRLQWKQGLIAQAEAASDLPVVPLDQPSEIDSVDGLDLLPVVADFRRVRTVCKGLDTAPFVELRSIQDGVAGVRLVSLCDKKSGQFVLIDRGFVSDEISARPPVVASDKPVPVEGVLRTPARSSRFAPSGDGKVFYSRDTEAMIEALGAAWPGARTIFATTSSNPEWLALKPSAPPAAFSNNHLGYAITWFGLALALAGFYIALLRRNPLKQPRSASEATGKEKDS